LPDDEWQELLQLAELARDARGSASLGEDAAEPLDGLRREHERGSSLAHPLARRVYAPLIARIAAGPLTIAQVGQSLDGRIATEGGDSHYINGEGGLDHLHRLRALVDAVVVGATTVVLDDPRLTTRRVTGANPVRVIVDPNGRVPPGRRAFDVAAPTLLLRAPHLATPSSDGAKGPIVVPIEGEQGLLPPHRILHALHERGLFTVLIEGGGMTISTFLRAAAVDRLHVIVAPLLIGPGRAAFQWPAIARLEQALHVSMTAHPLGGDMLFDCVCDNPR
jgi:riboflavin-specific deaminase-like protein